jgi:hypothetical protein
LSGWRERGGKGESESTKREEGWRDLCHYYSSISLDREEPSRSPSPATGIVVKYDELAEKSWIHSMGGVASRLYTRSIPESASKAV